MARQGINTHYKATHTTDCEDEKTMFVLLQLVEGAQVGLAEGVGDEMMKKLETLRVHS